MSLLVITSSPHATSPSTTLAKQLIKGAQTAGLTVNHYDIGATPIAPLTPTVLTPTTESPRLHEIMAAMVAADTVAFATPMHYYGMIAQLKALIDHMSEWETALHQDKQAILITTGHSDNFDALKAEFKALLGHFGWRFAGQVLASRTVDPDHLSFYPEQAFQLGKSLSA